MATNKFKSVMVNPSYELEFPPPQEFVKVNNIATFGEDVDAIFRQIEMHGDIIFGTDAAKLNFLGIMSLGVDMSGAPYGVIESTQGLGLKISGNILNGLTFYDGVTAVMEQSQFASISTNGFKTIGNLLINQSSASGWNFENGTIRNWNMYCESEIKTNNVIEDGGNGYSTIDLIAKKYSEGSLTDSISIGLNGSTKTVKVSDNATVQLPANTTIGGNTPATFGNNVSGTLKDLTFTDGITINKNQLILDPANYHDMAITFDDNEDPVKRGIKIEAYNFVQNIAKSLGPGEEAKNGLYLNCWSNGENYGDSLNGYIELSYGGSDEIETKINSTIISLQAPEVEISDLFTIPVYTTDDSGNYTKVNNETKTVRCVKQVLSDGTATYTLELA